MGAILATDWRGVRAGTGVRAAVVARVGSRLRAVAEARVGSEEGAKVGEKVRV